MSFGMVCGLLMLLWGIFGLIAHFDIGFLGGYAALGNVVLIFALLGWTVFGPVDVRLSE